MVVLSFNKNGYKSQQNVAFFSERSKEATNYVKTGTNAARKKETANNQSKKREYKNLKSNIVEFFGYRNLNEIAEGNYIRGIDFLIVFS